MNRVQLTDGHRPYLKAVEGVFGSEIDYAMSVKVQAPFHAPNKRIQHEG